MTSYKNFEPELMSGNSGFGRRLANHESYCVGDSTRDLAPCRGKVPPNKCSYLLANNTVGDVRGSLGGAAHHVRPGQQNSTLSKVGAAARNARCEADNFNSDKPEGSHRGAVYSHISKSAFAPTAD